MLTNESKKFINYFISDIDNKYVKSNVIRNLYNKLSNNKYKIDNIKIRRSNKKYPDSSFIHKSLNEKIRNKTNIYLISWSVKTKFVVNVKLYLYLDENEKFPNKELLINSISHILSYTNKSRNFDINLCLLDNKKSIRKNQKKITKLNVNSGSNRFSDIESEICVFRKEECIKVLIHEIIHGLRFSSLDNHDKITEKLCQKYKYKSKNILIDESYTEIWAKIINCYFISSLCNENNFIKFCTLLSLEYEFSIYQANKIKLFLKNIKDLDSDTNVSAYFFIVGEIFSDLEEFIKKCNYNCYLNDIPKMLEYIYLLDKFDKKRVSHNDKIFNSMRMSICELKII